MSEEQKKKLEKEANKYLRKAGKSKKENDNTKNKLEGKYDYQRRTLKDMLVKSGKWSDDMRAQLVLASRSGALASAIWDELEQDDRVVITEKSREGDERRKVNPLIGAYLTVEAAFRRNLRALKLNKEKEANDKPMEPEENDALAQLMAED